MNPLLNFQHRLGRSLAGYALIHLGNQKTCISRWACIPVTVKAAIRYTDEVL